MGGTTNTKHGGFFDLFLRPTAPDQAGYGPLHGLTFLARSRLDSRKIAETLIAHRADVMPGGRDGTERGCWNRGCLEC